ncbi:MAG: hypothetical protein NT007_19455 [Candidatus Kapabacteria bacterium]|nr:hypothetical protein [Candidatus Kapabacteria bacterium]
MFVATGIWIYIFVISIISGLSILRIINKVFDFEEELPPLSLLVISGLCFSTVIGMYLSLVSKTGLLVNLILLAYILIYSIYDKEFVGKTLSIYISKLKKIKPATWILALGAIIFAYLLTFCWTLSDDTNGYHAITIKWIENYPAIPGLTNIYHRLGFNNSWLITSAIFSFSFLGKMSFNALGQFLLLFAIFYFITGVNRILSKDFRASNWMRLFFIPLTYFSFFYPHLGWIVSPSPDIPTTIFLWVLFCNLLEISEVQKNGYFSSSSVLILILISFLITIKLSSIPVFIVFAYIILRLVIEKKIKYSLILATGFFFIVLPWLLRYVILSGYLIFPFPSIDLFSFDWKVPIQSVINEKSGIENWAKWPAWFQKPANVEFKDLTFSKWYNIWFMNQSFQYLKIVLYGIPIMLGISILFIVAKSVQTKNFIKKHNLLLITYLTGIAGSVYWFLSAPDLRFGWGFMFSTFALLAFQLLYWIFNIFTKFRKIRANQSKKSPSLLPKPVYLILSILFVILFSGHEYLIITKVADRMKQFGMVFTSERIFTPADYPYFDGKVKLIDNKEIFYSQPNYGPLPNAENETEINNCELRGNSISDGFRVKIKR